MFWVTREMASPIRHTRHGSRGRPDRHDRACSAGNAGFMLSVMGVVVDVHRVAGLDGRAAHRKETGGDSRPGETPLGGVVGARGEEGSHGNSSW